MRVSVGDIVTFMYCAGKTYGDLINLCEKVYTPINYDRLKKTDLSQTFTTATVYCWLFQNMTLEIAEALHSLLCNECPSYLGAMDVDFSNHIHLQFFRNSLIEKYRFHGDRCSVFYAMSYIDDPDNYLISELESFGYAAKYEDTGARRTYFDNYDQIEHFKRVEEFRKTFIKIHGMTLDIADDVISSLEELHPRLFDIFAAAAKALNRAETEEDLAQASLSGRRILEKLADYLYPPSNIKYKNRKVGNSEYKNRLWAYVETTVEKESIDQGIISTLGKEVDRLIELFNKGLHANPTKEKVEESFKDLMYWIKYVVDLSPESIRKPYLAYGIS